MKNPAICFALILSSFFSISAAPVPIGTPVPSSTPKLTATPIPLITPTPAPGLTTPKPTPTATVYPTLPPLPAPSPTASRPPVVAGVTVFMNKTQVSATFKVQISTDQVTWKDVVSVPFTTTPPIQYYRAVVDFSTTTPSPSPTPAPALTKSIIHLEWNAATCQNCDLGGYKIWDAVEYSNGWKSTDVGNVISSLIANLDPNTTYSFYATAYDTLGRESGPSNTVLFRGNPVAW